MNDHEKLLTIFLASTIHEAKNHLGGLSNWVAQIADQFPDIPQTMEAKIQIALLQQSLNQVLTHYRTHKNGYDLHIDLVDLDHFFELLELRHKPVLLQNSAKLSFIPKTEEDFFFDEQIINNVLDTVIHNALSAGARHIQIASSFKDGYHLLEIQDDGNGFPTANLTQPLDQLKDINQEKCKTGVGLYLANEVLKSHRNQILQGKVTIENKMQGGCVTLWFP